MYVLELGGQDDAFAAREAQSAATDVEVVAPGLATARGVTGRVRDLAFTRRASRLVGRCDPDVGSARATLEAAAVDREGTVAVRAEDVRGRSGVDTQHVERELGQVLVDRGFAVDLDDPDHELRAVFAPETCLLGWLSVESRRDFGDRQPTDRPFFQPGSMDPLEARALVNIAGAGPDATILDPMCGTGGVLIEAGLVGARPLGMDVQPRMVAGTRENLAAESERAPAGTPLSAGWFSVLRGDATSVPLRDGAVDAAVFDVPYGRQSRIEGASLAELVRDALAEARRVADRAAVVADREWIDAASDAGWTVADVYDRPVHRSLTRYVHDLR